MMHVVVVFIMPQVYGALRMTVKILLMWNSKMIIDGGEDVTVETSWLEASNLIVLKVLFSSSLRYSLYFVACNAVMYDSSSFCKTGIVCHTF